MNEELTPGKRFRQAMEKETPLALVGTINAYCARMAQKSGFNAIYLSGAGVANASFGMPDLGITTLGNVVEDVFRITNVCDLPLIVDADTGFSDPAKTTRALIDAGAAGMQLEDQVDTKRCGHRPGKVLVSTGDMQDRIKAAVDARTDQDFIIIARTDAHAVEGIDAAIGRSLKYVDAGANIIFAEALTHIDEFRKFCKAMPVPVLANLTEFGKTPLYTMEEMSEAGIKVVLYPLSAFRAMSAAAYKVYQTLRADGSQATLVKDMQTREELYDILDYYKYEEALDQSLKDKG